MSLIRKLVFLPAEFSGKIVNDINEYFDKGYDIEKILSADNGHYMLLVYVGNENLYAKKDVLSNLIEENNQKWYKTNTGDIKFN